MCVSIGISHLFANSFFTSSFFFSTAIVASAIFFATCSRICRPIGLFFRSFATTFSVSSLVLLARFTVASSSYFFPSVSRDVLSALNASRNDVSMASDTRRRNDTGDFVVVVKSSSSSSRHYYHGWIKDVDRFETKDFERVSSLFEEKSGRRRHFNIFSLERALRPKRDCCCCSKKKKKKTTREWW